MAQAVQNPHLYTKIATRDALDIVFKLIKGTPQSHLSSQEIFNAIHPDRHATDSTPTSSLIKQKKAARLSHTLPTAQYPDHPVRSMAYLKRVVLQDLAERKLVEKKRYVGPPSTPEELASYAELVRKVDRHNKRVPLEKNAKMWATPTTTITKWAWTLTEKGLNWEGPVRPQSEPDPRPPPPVTSYKKSPIGIPAHRKTRSRMLAEQSRNPWPAEPPKYEERERDRRGRQGQDRSETWEVF